MTDPDTCNARIGAAKDHERAAVRARVKAGEFGFKFL
jgi:hypothetical protein